MTTYNYSLTSDFIVNHICNPDRLSSEIKSSVIVTAFDYISTAGDVVSIVFKGPLSSGDQTLLTSIVNTHTGAELLLIQPQAVQLYSGEIPAPVASDGKPFFLPNIFPAEVLIVFAGWGDGPSGRFLGTPASTQVQPLSTGSVTLSFNDGVYIAGGHVDYTGGDYGSYADFKLYAPATTTKAPAVAGQGNCNKVATGLGFNLIVPAAGNGQYDIDVPVPVPATNVETNANSGYWNYSDPWNGKGTVSAGTPGTSKYNLYDATLPLATFAKVNLILEQGSRDVVAQSIKPKWILPQWLMNVTIHNNSSTKVLTASWDFITARRSSN